MYKLQIDKPYLQAYLEDIYVDWNADKPLYKEAQFLFRFNSFSVPNELIRLIEHGCFDYFRDNKALYICVDHSFVEELTESGQDINIIFIDHHLAEKQNVKYASNARMMAENYPDLIKYLVNVIPYFNSIVVLMHNDLDGLASGIIMKSIINDIFDENRHEGINVQSGVAFAKILGSYGDIDSDKLKTLETFFHKSLHANIDKKFESIRKNIGTFFKATRAIHDSLFYIRNYQDIVNEKYKEVSCINWEEVNKYDDYIKQFNIETKNILSLFLSICESLEECKKITAKYVVYLINVIMTNKTLIRINEEYYNVSEKILEQYLGGSSQTPLELEITATFNGSNTKYKILIIDTPFDVARSVMFKYELKIKNLLKQSIAPVNYSYKVTDWLKYGKDIVKLSHNIACFNKAINKLTLYSSENSSAYDIALGVFHGGGHITENGSIGSVKLENEYKLFDKIKLTDIF